MGRALAVLATLVAPGAALAHHSVSMFDLHRMVTLEGTVSEFQWSNPHVWIEVVTNDPDGMMEIWNIEGSAPRVLAREGWRPNFIKPGDMITLTIYPRKDGHSGGYYADVGPLYVNGELRISGLESTVHSPSE